MTGQEGNPLTIFRVRLNNGVPNQLTVVFASGTMDANQLITTGSALGPRPWLDTNRNGFPDCDFTVPALNGECGNAVGSSRAVIFRAWRAIARLL